MSLRPPVPHRLLALALATGCGLASLPAAEPGPASSGTPAPSAPAPATSIDSAKKDFDALKAARDAAQRGQGSSPLPRLAVPEFQTGLGHDPRPVPGSPTLDPAKKSANWLVEGVAREAARHERDSARASSSRDRREPSSAGGEGRGASPFPAGETSESALPSPGDPEAQPARAPDSRDSRPADHAEKAPAAPNPLDRYLAAWMTPGDYAALQPSLGAGLSVSSAEPGGLGAVSLPASLGGGLSGLALPGGPASPDALGVAPPAPSAPPRDNPYLQTFTLPPAPAVGLPATPPPPAPSTLTPAPSPAPANPAPRPSVPDFARPAQDEKYFKQLKRF